MDFLGDLPFPGPCGLALLYTKPRFSLIGSQDIDAMSRPDLFSHSLIHTYTPSYDGDFCPLPLAAVPVRYKCLLKSQWLQLCPPALTRASRCRWLADFLSGISRFPRPCIRALLHTHITSPPSAFKTSLSIAAHISPPLSILTQNGLVPRRLSGTVADDTPYCLALHFWEARISSLLLEISTNVAMTQEYSGETGRHHSPPAPPAEYSTYVGGARIFRELELLAQRASYRKFWVTAYDTVQRPAVFGKLDLAKCARLKSILDNDRRLWNNVVFVVTQQCTGLGDERFDVGHLWSRGSGNSPRCCGPGFNRPAGQLKLVCTDVKSGRKRAGQIGTIANRHSASEQPLLASRLGEPGSIPGRVTPDFRKWESCRLIPHVGGFSRGSPVSPALAFQRCSIILHFTLNGSQDLVLAKSSRRFPGNGYRNFLYFPCVSLGALVCCNQRQFEKWQERKTPFFSPRPPCLFRQEKGKDKEENWGRNRMSGCLYIEMRVTGREGFQGWLEGGRRKPGELSRDARVVEMGDPREDPQANGIVWHGPHVRGSGVGPRRESSPVRLVGRQVL
ncbi:hypothetical protein PR048_009679 [Dryococelus australis]|uniref:Uncharacterized protein n=1 Tax=Dryococelus australis TaxID=614101 RepID=A0ABQ9I0L0_9NEOP|nr:hypothetical protein PR048_009679 [Dryococelus australis]